MINDEILKDKLLRDIINEDIDNKILDTQSNWEQNDENQPDYIKNKPFGEEITETSYIIKNSFGLIGRELKYIHNGEEYILEVKSTSYSYYDDAASSLWNIKYVGNTSIPIVDNTFTYPVDNVKMSELPHDDVPFVIVWYDSSQLGENAILAYDSDNNSIRNNTIYYLTTEIKTLDEKFIPSTIARTTTATETAAGLMSAEDKAKVNKMPTIKIHDLVEV